MKPCPETTNQLGVGDWSRHPTKEQADFYADRWRELGWEVAVTETGLDTYRFRVEIMGKQDGGES